jgi:hypothetical protein
MGGQPPILPSPVNAEDTMSPTTPQVSIIPEVLVHMPTDFFHCERLFDATGIGTEVRRYPTLLSTDGLSTLDGTWRPWNDC